MAAAAARADLVALRLEPVILDAIDPDRLKRAVADVQRDLGHLDAARRSAAMSGGVKCSPAVGAAIEPRARAKMV